jgi:O-antigen/teichoic acid export membrane protein
MGTALTNLLTNTHTANKRVVLLNAAAAGATRLVQLTVFVWLQQYLIRRISPAEYSLLAIVQAAVFLIPLLTTSLISASARFMTESYAKNQVDQISRATRSMLPFTGVAALGIAALGALLAGYVDVLFTIPERMVGDTRIMLGLMAGTYALRAACIPFFSGIFVVQKHRVYYLLELTCEALKLAILLALLFGVSTRILWLVVAQCAASLVETTLTVRLSLRYLPTLWPAGQPSRAIVRKQVHFGAWVLLERLADGLRRAMDPVILNRLAEATHVASFHLGSLPSNHIHQMILLATSPIQQPLIGFFANNQHDVLERTFLRLGRYALWAQGLIACPLIVYSHELLSLYLGERAELYQPAAYVMPLLLLAWTPFYSLLGLPYLAHAHAKLRGFNTIFLASQLMNIGLTLYFVSCHQLGAYGSALATFLSLWLFSALGFLPLSIRSFGISAARYAGEALGRGLAPWITTVLFLLWMRPANPSWGHVLLASAGGAAVFCATVAACMARDDWREVREGLKTGEREILAQRRKGAKGGL